MSKLILSITLIVLAASVAQSCRKETTKADFDYLKFNGTWYTIQVIPNIFERGLKCMQTTDVADTKTKGHFKVQDKGLRESDNSVVTADSTLITPDEKNPGFLQNVAGPGGLIKVPFYILDTDYENYAFTYTCVGNLLSIGMFYSDKWNRWGYWVFLLCPSTNMMGSRVYNLYNIHSL